MKGDIYYIDYDPTKRNTAGAKAPDDIVKICGDSGYKRFEMPQFPSGKNPTFCRIWLLTVGTFAWIKNMNMISKDSILIYQHPMYGIRLTAKFIPLLKKRKNVKAVVLIHDLESLRKGIAGVIKDDSKRSDIADNVLLKEFDSIICHTPKMKQHLIACGFDGSKIAELKIFDYLCEVDQIRRTRDKEPSIAIAGNLAPGKCGYIYKICGDGANAGLNINLYGNNYDASRASENMNYHGSFPPDEIPSKLEGDFGLVWDGISAETCAGNTGEYLRYNCPHKTSLYLAAGMPVIIWSQAAMADFVEKNGVGITVDSLENLEEVIASVDDESYARMCENAQKIGKRLREGYYFRRAMDEVLEELDF